MPFVRSRYPADWEALSRSIRERAGQRCECTGQCGDAHHGPHPETSRCGAPNGELITRHSEQPARWTWTAKPVGPGWEGKPVRVVLTVAHLDHDTKRNDPSNLAAMCQRCHLRLDRFQHAANARATARTRKAVGELPGVRRQ